MKLGLNDLEDLARGAAFLGTGRRSKLAGHSRFSTWATFQTTR